MKLYLCLLTVGFTGVVGVASAAPTCSPWVDNTNYTAGEIVTYAGRAFTATKAHFAAPAAGWTPLAARTLWKEGASCAGVESKLVCSNWQEERRYEVGDKIKYGDKSYVARVEHVSYANANWTPTAAPSLWLQTSACDVIMIDSTGGVLEKPNLAKVYIQPNTFNVSTPVSLKQTSDEGIAYLVDLAADFFPIKQRSNNEITIKVGKQQPTLPVDVALYIPQSLRQNMGATEEVRALYLNIYSDDTESHESFDLLSARGTKASDTLSTTLPIEAFYKNEDGDYEAVVTTVTTTSASPKSLKDSSLFQINNATVSELILDPAYKTIFPFRAAVSRYLSQNKIGDALT